MIPSIRKHGAFIADSENVDEHYVLNELRFSQKRTIKTFANASAEDVRRLYEEFNLDTNPYAIDVINHYKDIKGMFTLTLDSIMNKLNLSNNAKSSSKNIFDVLAEEINNTTTDKAS